MDTTESVKEETDSFWKNLILITFFFTITPIALITTLFSLVSLNHRADKNVETPISQNVSLSSKSGARIYASLPTNLPSVGGKATVKDARPELVRQYLAYWRSPLEPYANFIVEAADRHGLDYRLTTAIAQQESNLCKVIPPGSNNCWGWGIHSAGTLRFDSFEEGIETVSAGLRKEYLDKGFKTIEEIMSKYTPLSKGSWAAGVTKFMSEMD